MGSPVDELSALLREANVRVTFDPGRNFTHPCTFCATTEKPRDLVTIGTYPNGDDLTRPVCPDCTRIVEARREAADPRPTAPDVAELRRLCGEARKVAGPSEDAPVEWDAFIGPCSHGRDPYTRCDFCGDMSRSQARAVALLPALADAAERACMGAADLVASEPQGAPKSALDAGINLVQNATSAGLKEQAAGGAHGDGGREAARAMRERCANEARAWKQERLAVVLSALPLPGDEGGAT